MPIDTFMREKLALSGLLPEDVDATLVLDFQGNQTEDFWLPYYEPNARPDPATGRAPQHPIMRRRRLAHPTADKGKYDQPSVAEIVAAGRPSSDATYPYLNPYHIGAHSWADLALVQNKKLLIVEGEIKAACAGKHLQQLAVGIPGCNGGVYRDDKGIFRVHPVLGGLLQPFDLIEVCLDGDIFSNPNVNWAAGSLKRALARVGRAPVFVILPPPVPGRGAGLDDWLMGISDPAERKHAFEALPRVSGDDFQEDLVSLADDYGLIMNKKGTAPIPTAVNIRKILERHPRYKNRYYFDLMRGNLYRNDPEGPAPFVDSFGVDEQHWLQDRFGLTVSKTTALDSLRWMADQKQWRRNLLLEKIPAWDNVPRLEEMFIHGWGVSDDDYTRAVGRNWLVSAMARASDPGCKVDTMLVLVGPQGAKKSMSLEAMAGGFYIPTHSQAHEKDFILALHRGWLIDLAELSSMNHTDANHIKGVITTATDFIRPPYATAVTEMKRHSIMVGTTNEERFLKDPSGNRRFWPLEVGNIDMDWIHTNRAQLWAEALVAYKAGTHWWNMPGSTLVVQDARLEVHPWEELIRQYLNSNEHSFPIIDVFSVKYRFVTTEDIFEMLNVPPERRVPHMAKRITACVERVFKTKWDKYRYQGSIPIFHNPGGGTVDNARGFRAIVHGQPNAVVVNLPLKGQK